MSKYEDPPPDDIKCVKNPEKNGSKRQPDNDEFATAVKDCDKDKVKYFLKNGYCLTDLISSDDKDSRKHATVIEYIMKFWPRPVQYFLGLFDDHITNKKDLDIDDHDCTIDIDFSVLMQPDGCKRSDMKILKTLLRYTKKYDTDLLTHPLILSYLRIKWISGLRVFYTVFVAMYMVFVLTLTWIALTIYTPPKHSYVHSVYCILFFLMTIMVIQEILFIAITIWTGNFISSIKKPIWLLNWTSKALWVIVVNTDHEVLNRDWPKFVTAAALLFAWMEITVLLSHFPECGYLFHMFSVVISRAAKVFFLFGFHIIMGFSLAFFIMFHGETDISFKNFFETFTKIVVMTSELDYSTMLDSMNTFTYKIILQMIILLYIFFVSIVMMNFLLALIISDTEDLKKSGKVRRTSHTIELIDVLDNVLDIVTSTGVWMRKKMKTVWEIYPGRPIRFDDVISVHLQEQITKIFMKGN